MRKRIAVVAEGIALGCIYIVACVAVLRAVEIVLSMIGA